MKAIRIQWDVDNREDLSQLPTEVLLPENLKDPDEISDYLSDLTGFCHKGFELEETRPYSRCPGTATYGRCVKVRRIRTLRELITRSHKIRRASKGRAFVRVKVQRLYPSAFKKKSCKVLCVIEQGVLVGAYSDNPEIDLELLDYDSFKQADENSEEYQGYKALEQELKGGLLTQVW